MILALKWNLPSKLLSRLVVGEFTKQALLITGVPIKALWYILKFRFFDIEH